MLTVISNTCAGAFEKARNLEETLGVPALQAQRFCANRSPSISSAS